MKKAIVTGSNGFIGSNVCKRLCADGIKVFAVVKDESENIDNIKNLSGIEIVYNIKPDEGGSPTIEGAVYGNFLPDVYTVEAGAAPPIKFALTG